MKQKEFQDFVVKNLTSLNERMTDQEKFQEFAVNKLTNLSQDMGSVKGDVSSLNVRMTGQEKFQELAAKHLMNQSEDIKSMKNDISSLKSTVVRIETRMENEIIDKIKGLFDGQKQHEDRLNRIEKIAR